VPIKLWLPFFFHQSLPKRFCFCRSDGPLTFEAIQQKLEIRVVFRVFLKPGKMSVQSYEKQFVIMAAATHNEVPSRESF